MTQVGSPFLPTNSASSSEKFRNDAERLRIFGQNASGALVLDICPCVNTIFVPFEGCGDDISYRRRFDVDRVHERVTNGIRNIRRKTSNLTKPCVRVLISVQRDVSQLSGPNSSGSVVALPHILSKCAFVNQLSIGIRRGREPMPYTTSTPLLPQRPIFFKPRLTGK